MAELASYPRNVKGGSQEDSAFTVLWTIRTLHVPVSAASQVGSRSTCYGHVGV